MHTRVRRYSWSGGPYSYSTAVIMTWRSHGSRSRPARRGKGSTARRRDWRASSFLLLKPPLSLPPPPPFSALPCRPSLAVSVCPRAPHFLPLGRSDPLPVIWRVGFILIPRCELTKVCTTKFLVLQTSQYITASARVTLSDKRRWLKRSLRSSEMPLPACQRAPKVHFQLRCAAKSVRTARLSSPGVDYSGKGLGKPQKWLSERSALLAAMLVCVRRSMSSSTFRQVQ